MLIYLNLLSCGAISMMKEEAAKNLKSGILERLRAGEIIIGDGGYSWALEKRGYVRGGCWTPECTVEHPEAVRQLHREFARAGSDVLQTFTYTSDKTKMKLEDGSLVEQEVINQSACDIVHEVANEKDLLVCGAICTSFRYFPGCDKEKIQSNFRKQVEIFKKNHVDFLLGEQFEFCEEAEWCIEELKKVGLPVAITFCIGTIGDKVGNTPQTCAVRLAKAGADIIGLNCRFDPPSRIKTMRLMKEGLEKADLLSKVFLMLQPIGFMAPSTEYLQRGYTELPEWPFAVDQRSLTRFEVQKYTREAYDLGVRYFGGCCGFEPHHIRAIAEELAPERGRFPDGSKKNKLWGEEMINQMFYPERRGRDYWENVQTSCGRSCCLSYQLKEDHPQEKKRKQDKI